MKVWLIEFRNGFYFQGDDRDHSGPADTAVRYESEEEANRAIRQREWMGLAGPSAELVEVVGVEWTKP